MTNDQITLGLGGGVSFDSFVGGMQRFQNLVKALTDELGVSKSVNWSIHDLQAGSALVTVKGEAENIADVECVVRAYERVGKALELGSPIPYSSRVAEPADSLTTLLNDGISYFRFQTIAAEYTVSYNARDGEFAHPPVVPSIGSVKGRVQTLTERGSLRFTLFEYLRDRAVSCYLAEEQRELATSFWGKNVIVSGTVTRDRSTGRPLTIRRITDIQPVTPERSGADYRWARGALPRKPNSPMPEEIVRRLRDA